MATLEDQVQISWPLHAAVQTGATLLEAEVGLAVLEALLQMLRALQALLSPVVVGQVWCHPLLASL